MSLFSFQSHILQASESVPTRTRALAGYVPDAETNLCAPNSARGPDRLARTRSAGQAVRTIPASPDTHLFFCASDGALPIDGIPSGVAEGASTTVPSGRRSVA